MKAMKKLIIMFLSLFCVTFYMSNAAAQERTKIGDGIYVVSYGSTSWIENDNIGMSFPIKVEEAGKNSYGETLYNVLCENKTVKGVAKSGLTAAIKSALTAAGIPIPSWAIGPIVSAVYDGICDYYKD